MLMDYVKKNPLLREAGVCFYAMLKEREEHTLPLPSLTRPASERMYLGLFSHCQQSRHIQRLGKHGHITVIIFRPKFR
jgi:hypothetical protein